jgi:hypothetical protein
MGKYEPLAHFLDSRNEDSWTATFDQIEAKLGFTLPKSAYEHRAWWSNQQGPGHSQKEAWQAAGWETRDVDLRRRVVRFVRARRRPSSEPGTARPSDIESLWHKASEISGVTDRTELERAAVTTFIQREAGRRLIEMGGTMPDAKAPPRRRFG